MSALLELRSVSHAYQAAPVLDDLSFSLNAGEIACLLGSSGCGKTTALRCIAGLEALRGGEIHLHGECIDRAGYSKPAHRREIGMVFQDYALFPHLSVAANVGFGLQRLGAAARRERAGQMLELVGLSGLSDALPHELSGGQQQRVALARALAPQPRLLLLDEPFSNLDVDLRQRLSHEVREILNSQGSTAIMVTHDQQEAFAMADRIGVMRGGRLQQWATPDALYQAPANRYVAGFIGQGSFLPGRVAAGGRVLLEGEELHSAQPLPYAPGAAVDVLLRPDQISLQQGSALQAVVKSRVFMGAAALYTLQLPSGRTLQAQLSGLSLHAPGERIGIRLAPAPLIMFAA